MKRKRSVMKMKTKRHTKNIEDYAIYILLAICLISVAAKMMFISPKVVWDEAIYIGMGKSIYSSGASGLWEMIRPLGLPLITGLIWKSGADVIIASKIFSILISCGIIVTTYLVAKELLGKRYALISSALIAITPIFFRYSEYILTDHISTLFLLLSILFLIKDRYILSGIFAGLAFWFKFTHILYLLALGIFITYKLFRGKDKYAIRTIISQKNRRYVQVIALMIWFMAIYFIMNYFLYSSHYSWSDATFKPFIDASAYANNPYQNMKIDGIAGFFSYIFYYIQHILLDIRTGSILYLFAIIYFIRFRVSFRDDHAAVLFVFLTYLAYFSYIPYKTDRFMVTFLPFLAIYASYGIIWTFDILDDISSRKNKPSAKKIQRYPTYAALAIIILMAAASIYSDVEIYGSNRKDVSYYRSDPDLENVERYFDINGIDGPILVTNPIFTAYSDKRFIGAYDVTKRDSLYVNDWEQKIRPNAIAYMGSAIPCLGADSTCISNKKALISMIQKGFERKDTLEYQNADIIFYVRK